jgi:cell division protein FtsB
MCVKSSASALLLVIFITSVLSLLTFACWHKSSNYLDLAVQREQYYKNFYLTEKVLDFAISVAKKNFDSLQKTNIDTSYLVNKDNQDLQAKLFLEKKDNRAYLVSILQNKKNQKELCKLSCLLSKFVEEKKVRFAISYFTIGNPV